MCPVGWEGSCLGGFKEFFVHPIGEDDPDVAITHHISPPCFARKGVCFFPITKKYEKQCSEEWGKNLGTAVYHSTSPWKVCFHINANDHDDIQTPKNLNTTSYTG